MFFREQVSRVDFAAYVLDSDFVILMDSFANGVFTNVDPTHPLLAGGIAPIDCRHVIVIYQCRAIVK